MKLQNRSLKVTALACVTLALATMLSAWAAARTKAAMPRECPDCFVSTGMFEVSNEEMVKAWVVNTGAQRGMTAKWRILDATGNTLAESGLYKMAPNWAASFEFMPVAAVAGQRIPIRVELTVGIMREDLRGTRGEYLFIPTLAVSDRATGKKSFGEDFFIIIDY